MGLKLNGRLGKIARYITPKFDAVTSPSSMVTQHFIENFSANPSSSIVIHNGTDLKQYQTIQDDSKFELKKKLGIDPNRKTIISIGWLRKGKGHNYLIESLSQFDQVDQWQVVILGMGPEEDNLKHLAAELNISHKVFLPGMQENVSDWLSISDIAVSASLSEGLSNALIEACASSLPIIATNVGGNPEIVEDGVNGLLVDSGSSEGLSEAIGSLLQREGELRRMAGESRRIAESKFSIPQMVEALEALYLDLAT
jgi:glycosyltransferase involved in cell wall biosynthesis